MIRSVNVLGSTSPWQCKLNDVLSVGWGVFSSVVYIEWDSVLPPCYVEIRKREDTHFLGGIVQSLPIFFRFELQVCIVSAGSIREEKPNGCMFGSGCSGMSLTGYSV